MPISAEFSNLVKQEKSILSDRGSKKPFKRQKTAPQHQRTARTVDVNHIVYATTSAKERAKITRAGLIINTLKGIRTGEITISYGSLVDHSGIHYPDANTSEVTREVNQVYQLFKRVSLESGVDACDIRLIDHRSHELRANIEVGLPSGKLLFFRIVSDKKSIIKTRAELRDRLHVPIHELNSALKEKNFFVVHFALGDSPEQVVSGFKSKLSHYDS